MVVLTSKLLKDKINFPCTNFFEVINYAYIRAKSTDPTTLVHIYHLYAYLSLFTSENLVVHKRRILPHMPSLTSNITCTCFNLITLLQIFIIRIETPF